MQLNIEYFHLDPCKLPHSIKITSIIIKWKPLPIGFFKLNIDGAFNYMSNNGGSGRVLRNHNGS